MADQSDEEHEHEYDRIATAKAEARELALLVASVNNLRESFKEFHTEFQGHVLEERVAIEVAKLLGTTKEAQARIAFLDRMIAKAQRWEELRRKMVERSFLAAVMLLVAYLVTNIGATLISIGKFFVNSPKL